MKTRLTNVHFRPVETSAVCEPPVATLPRERRTTNDPAREFLERPGAVRSLPNEIAALILARQERRFVTREGITVTGEDGVERKFWHENSITCATKASNGEKVLLTYNRYSPRVIHILDNDGGYIESIPEKGFADHFDPAGTREQLSAVRRDEARLMRRMENIHGPDALKTLQRERENLGQMQKVVSTFDRPDDAGIVPSTTPSKKLSRNNPARRIAAAERSLDRAIETDKRQKAGHQRTIRREGAAAARDLMSLSAEQEQEQSNNAGAELLSALVGQP